VNHVSFPSPGARRIGGGPAQRAGQRGVSLIIAMVMLVVIGFVSVAIMRNATSSDQVAMNNRLQTQANQYAQAALRFCENQIVTSGGPITVQAYDPAGAHWLVKNNWLTNAGGVYTLQAADLPSANTPAHFPQCIVETSSFSTKVFFVTARGFSNDYAYNTTSGATTAGSVIWLQSQVVTN
jgi:Tfp pilus assembly protein PilX